MNYNEAYSLMLSPAMTSTVFIAFDDLWFWYISMEGRDSFLDDSQDVLSADAISSLLQSDFSGDIIVKDTTASTNDDAKDLLPSAKHGTVIIANVQTAARGRMGRSFFAPDGGVYMSIILKPSVEVADTVLVTSASAVAVCRAIEAISDLHPDIKWVNDILVGGKKVCGILCEAVPSSNAIVVGIGINFCPQAFPAGVDSVAGYLFTKPPVSRNEFVAELLKELLAVIDSMASREYIAEYRRRSAVLGREIVYLENAMWHAAYAKDIDENGGLVVVEEKGQKVLMSGEISVRVSGKNSQ